MLVKETDKEPQTCQLLHHYPFKLLNVNIDRYSICELFPGAVLWLRSSVFLKHFPSKEGEEEAKGELCLPSEMFADSVPVIAYGTATVTEH